ncbi:MAG: 2-C-methyl-D-erythritol 4-phosphate cytidylyltransferase [Dehalococcoidia bacterium]|nr:2-C-methyl-D-erythritol 4-phosphate cytidylyltransferase [Dehalococcoidia bacterium]
MEGLDKLFTPLLGKPLLFHSLHVLQTSPLVHAIVLVLSDDHLAQGHALLDQYGWGKVRTVCVGGDRRQDSVRIGLEHLLPVEWVVVHDGARPCLNEDLLWQGLEASRETGAAVPVVVPKDTVKEVDDLGFVTRTLPRERLGLAQTPQVFRSELLLAAHRAVTATVTDDAAMVAMLGHRMKAFPGSYANIKVTTPEDMALAEALLARAGAQPEARTSTRRPS